MTTVGKTTVCETKVGKTSTNISTVTGDNENGDIHDGK